MRQIMCLLIVALLVVAMPSTSPADDAIKVTTEKMTFTLDTAELGSRTQKPGSPGNYPQQSTRKTIKDTVEVIKLNNGLIEAWICPAYGARLLRVVDLATQRDYFRWNDGEISDVVGWGGVGVEASFPFFEHGMHLRQPAGHRIITAKDGSVTVAMDMRFSHHQHERDATRYGRFSDEILSVNLAMQPGSTRITWHQRKENPNPLPRSDRMWNNTIFPAERPMKEGMKKDKKTKKMVKAMVEDREKMKMLTEFIYPARWVVDHGPRHVHTSPHWSNLDNWNVSHFAIDPLGFGGAWYPKEKVNRLRIHNTDPNKGPGMKLYTCFWAPMFELWGGQGYVFEHPGYLKPAYKPIEFTHYFYITHAIDKVTYATSDVAVSVDGKSFAIEAPYAAKTQVLDGSDKVVAQGNVKPRESMTGQFDGKRLVVKIDGKVVLDQAFPLVMPKPAEDTPTPDEMQAKFEALQRYLPSRVELENIMNNEGMPTSLSALREAKKITSGDKAAHVQSIARTVYRHGHLDEAERLSKLAPGPASDYLLGLIAWERGEKVDFGKADWQADYMRALLAVQQGDPKQAVEHVDTYLKHVPTAWRPRLLKAWLVKDKVLATALVNENPASIEALHVLAKLGDQEAGAARDAMLKDNPSAAEHLKAFDAEITKGEWSHTRRYEPAMPKTK